MPTIRVTVPKAAWSKDEKAKIVTKLTDGLNSVAGESGKGDIKQFINVHIEETAEGGYAMGGNVVA
ncbi:tautomerase family protein [Roseibium sp. MMSF_3544]|uniref:tautomerase family protein n=1 Tax=unclassified Roseibium TaxID=2629323 RepID=UPI00273E6195|nr:tautomerase family protein [Roseibium sp. MMSF_3544]